MPLELLALLPLAWLMYRLGLLRRQVPRWAFAVLALAVVARDWPVDGIDFALIKRGYLLVATAVVLLLALQRVGVAWTLDERHERRSLLVLACVSAVLYFNFFSFHGARTWIHYHDVAHYYLGSKYFGELGYGRLYTAMLRAEAELYDNRFKTLDVRDLETGEVVHVRALLVRSETVRAAFSPERWHEFKEDVRFFRERLGPLYGQVLLDHGFNPTPVWAVLGGSLARLVPAGSHAGILALTLIDPLLLLGAFAAIHRAFGYRGALLSLVHFCILFGATFGWTGGAFLRHLWFAACAVAIASLARRRHGLAGAWLGLACALRVFPAFLVAGAILHAVHGVWRRGRIPASSLRLLAGFALTLGLAVGSTALLPQGLSAWGEFHRNMQVHLRTEGSNFVGLTSLLGGIGFPAGLLAGLRVGLTIAVALAAFVLARRKCAPVAQALLGIPLVFASLDLAAYYYVFLVLMTACAPDGSPLRVGLLGLELVSYSVLLFQPDERQQFLARSLLVASLLGGLLLEGLLAERALRRRAHRLRAGAATRGSPSGTS